MLRVKIEDVPPLGATPKVLGLLEIQNDGSGTEESGNYDVRLAHGPKGRHWLKARVEGFPRQEKGPWHLVQAALQAV